MKSKKAVGHVIKPADRARIECYGRLGKECGKPAEYCEHVHWNTGNTKGVSFWYGCAEHTSPELIAELGVKAETTAQACTECGSRADVQTTCKRWACPECRLIQPVAVVLAELTR